MDAQPTVVDLPELFDSLRAAPENELVLCGTLRLAQRLQQRFAQDCTARGLLAWRSPKILTPSAWVDQQYEHAVRRAMLGGEALAQPLTSAQCELLWERAVLPEARENPLMRQQELARLAARTHLLVHAWQLRLDAGADPDQAAYRQWQRRYQAYLADIAGADAVARFQWCLADAPLASACAQRRLTLYGCELLPPVWAQLHELFGRHAVLRDQPPETGRPQALRYRDFDGECGAALHWAQERAAAGCKRVGIVVTDLDNRRARLERMADAWLNPEVLKPGGADRERAYNLSGGWPLRRHAMLASALSLWRLGCGSLPVAEAGALLRSRYWLGSGSLTMRARIDQKLRKRGVQRLTPRALAAAAVHADSASRLADHAVWIADNPLPRGRRGLAAWSAELGRWLGQAGWPGQDPLTSREFQARRDFTKLLDQLASLGHGAEELTAADAIDRLSRLAEASLFQPQSSPVAIEILSWDEAWGQDFDAVRLIGLDEGRCPLAAGPNPIVAFAEQRRAGIPEASPQRLRTQTLQMLRRACSAPEVVLSCALRDGDSELRPAPVTLELVEWPAQVSSPLVDPLRRAMQTDTPLEHLQDNYAPALAGDGITGGGTGLLGDQAACPFRAYARHRLEVQELPEPAVGMPPDVRGKLMHRTLETLWISLVSQRHLLAMDAAARQQLLESHLDAAIAGLRNEAPGLGNRQWALERQRAMDLIENLLAIEAQRPDFKVRSRESPASLKLGPLELSMRPDRVDLCGGKSVVLDYKTGGINPPWGDERPEEPQLLLYALADDSNRGLAYVQISAKATEFRGIADGFAPAPGVVPAAEDRKLKQAASTDWQALRKQWQEMLSELAWEYANGEASVRPRKPASTCQWCGLQPFCRIGEMASAQADEGGADDAADT